MTDKKPAFETKDISFGAIVSLIGLLCILLSVTVLATRLFDRWFRRGYTDRTDASASMQKPLELAPEPRLQVNPTVDLIRLRDVEDVALNNYAWIDPDSGRPGRASPEAGRVRIPITRAMEILAEKGLPAGRQGLPSRAASEEKSE